MPIARLSAVLVACLACSGCSERSGSRQAGDAAVDAGAQKAADAAQLVEAAAGVVASVCACGLCEREQPAALECVEGALARVAPATLACYEARLGELQSCVQAASCDPGGVAACACSIDERECDLFPSSLMRELTDCGGVSACVLQPVACIPSEFECRSGDRIPLAWRCNFNVDCLDESDEADCSDQAFICADGREIPRGWRCDREPDCAGGEDELDCP